MPARIPTTKGLIALQAQFLLRLYLGMGKVLNFMSLLSGVFHRNTQNRANRIGSDSGVGKKILIQ